MERIPSLDGWRGIAVLAVFCVHYLTKCLPSLFGWGWVGVDFFFVLSGFLITGILYDSRDTEHRFRNFYTRRSLRIFPLYFGVLGLCLLTAPLFHWQWHPAWWLWPIYLGNYARFVWLTDFTRDMFSTEHLRALSPFPFRLYTGHFWSLCIEEQFYLVWPMVVFAVRSRRALMHICLASYVACLGLRVAACAILPGSYLAAGILERVTLFRADALLLGGYAALALRGPEAENLLRSAKRIAFWICIALASLEISFLIETGHLFPATFNGFILTIGFSIIDLLAACVLLIAIEQGTWAARLGAFKPLRELGVVSYGFYVFHDLPHELYGRLARLIWPHATSPLLVTAGIALPATILLSVLSYRYYERPFLALKNRVGSTSTHRAQEAVLEAVAN